MKTYNSFKYMLISALFLLMVTACDTVENTNGKIALNFSSSTTLQKANSDEIQLTEVSLMLKDVQLDPESQDVEGEHSEDRDEVNIIIGPYVVNLNLTGMTTDFAVSGNIPTGIYEEVEFSIHKLDASEISPDPRFVDGNEMYSVIAAGTFNGTEFTYKSRKSFHQEKEFDAPIQINENETVAVTITVDPFSWFYKEGVALDPNDPANEADIDANIDRSFQNAFQDNNHDGEGD